MKKIEDGTLLHGKKERVIQTMDDVWNAKKYNPYSTNNLENYTAQIKKMNKTDLFAHAAELGVKPTNPANRSITENKLIAKFKKTQLELKPIYQDKDEEREKEIAEKVKKIMTSK